MTVFHVNVMWALVLLGVTLWTTCCLLMNPGLRGVRLMGLGLSYAVGAWMAVALPWRETVVTWCVFAAAGGAAAFAYELWARWRYRGTGRRPRPLVLVQGILLWPALLPDALEGACVDAGILPPARRDDEPVPATPAPLV